MCVLSFRMTAAHLIAVKELQSKGERCQILDIADKSGRHPELYNTMMRKGVREDSSRAEQ